MTLSFGRTDSFQVVRILDDESISIVGRADSQVKIRGHRVELDEVNHFLSQQPNIADVASIAHNNRLLSFVSLQSGLVKAHDARCLGRQLVSEVAKKLPHYMVPGSVYILRDSIPLTTTYKLDFKRLLAFANDFDAETSDEEHTSMNGQDDWDDLSRTVAGIIAQISGLSIDNITPRTSIFTLGLDSISAIRISSALREQGHGEISVSLIMQEKTPKAIATAIAAEIELRNVSNCIADSSSYQNARTLIDRLSTEILADMNLEADSVQAIAPCTSLQEGILLETMKSMDTTYINHSIIELHEEISSNVLEAACRELVNRTEMLRTCFAYTSHKDLPCIQVVLKNPEISWTSRTADNFSSTLHDWQSQVANELDLQRPPVRFLFVNSEHARYLVISLHHSIFDGWSLGLIHNDLDRLCQGQSLATRPGIFPSIEYAYDAAKNSNKQDDDWEAYLHSYEPSSFPILSTTSETAQSIMLHNLGTSLGTIQKSASNNSVSILSILQTSWALLLSQISGNNDLCFGSVTSGRTLPIKNIEDVVTPLFNVLPIRVESGSDCSFLALSNKLQAGNLLHLANPHYPLVRASRAAKITNGEALFDTVLILQRAHELESSKTFKAITDDGDSNVRHRGSNLVL